MKKRIAIALAALCAAGIVVSGLSQATATGPYRDSSGSMQPVVGTDDVLNCMSKGAGDLAYGDLVIYRIPTDNKTLWVKMVVGFAGDTVQMKDGILWINGKAVPRRPAGDVQLPGSDGGTVARYEETLPGGVKTFVLDTLPNSMLDNTAPLEVPDGHIFVIGSHRDNSVDSRMVHGHGPVPVDNVLCKAGI